MSSKQRKIEKVDLFSTDGKSPEQVLFEDTICDKINEIIDIINEQAAFPLIRLSSPVEVGNGEFSLKELKHLLDWGEMVNSEWGGYGVYSDDTDSDELGEKLVSKLQAMIKESK